MIGHDGGQCQHNSAFFSIKYKNAQKKCVFEQKLSEAGERHQDHCEHTKTFLYGKHVLSHIFYRKKYTCTYIICFVKKNIRQ